MKDKPGNYCILFPALTDKQDRYASRAISYVTPAINNSGKM